MSADHPLTSSWRPGAEFLDSDPSSLASRGENDAPRLAKDAEYATAVFKAWKEETEKNDHRSSVAAPLVYDSNDGCSLHGHIYRPSPPSASNATAQLPGIVLFHTGAGPQDVFLRWKADSLASDASLFPSGGCIVLIADILGDAEGWAWSSDRSRYQTVRSNTLVPDAQGQRQNLQGRVRAAIDALSNQPGVDPDRIGVLGFCLGGHPVLELARMKIPAVKAMATFHGVFDGVGVLSSVGENDGRGGHQDDAGAETEYRAEVLVCTGIDDPFVPPEDVALAEQMFRDLGCKCTVMKFENTRHGFTNPAQDFNPSPSFGYNPHSEERAMLEMRNLLQRRLC